MNTIWDEDAGRYVPFVPEVQSTGAELRSLCASVDRIREAAGVGADTDIEDLMAAVAELRQERDEALAEVGRLAAELERWPTALTVDGPPEVHPDQLSLFEPKVNP